MLESLLIMLLIYISSIFCTCLCICCLDIISGQPKRHLLTTGWSVFVSAKRLVAGDSVLFIWYLFLLSLLTTFSSPWLLGIGSWLFLCFSSFRNEKNQLLLGIRRANRPQTVMPSSVLSSDSMHIGLLAAAAHAAATNSCFTVFYNPRLSMLSKFPPVVLLYHKL